jgi:hypothetical protein
MDKFDEKLYHLLSEYCPEYKDKKLSKKAKLIYKSTLVFYLTNSPLEVVWNLTNWYLALTSRLIQSGVEQDFADVLSSIRDDWELTDLD